MSKIEAEQWVKELQKSVLNGHLTQYQAHAEVFAELEGGDHDQETEKFLYTFTRRFT